MTITYVLQVLQAMEDGKIQDPTYIKDLEGELHKAFRRVRRRLLRLRSRAQYEIGEMTGPRYPLLPAIWKNLPSTAP